MATIGNSYITLLDVMRRTGCDGGIDMIVEALAKLNAVMKDAITIECNDGSAHQSTVRNGLPSVAWGRFNKGIPLSKSTTVQRRDTTGFVEGLSQVDKRQLDRMGDKAPAFRASEATPYLESMSQSVESMFFYGNLGTTPEGFNGLGAFYGQLPVATSNASNQVINGGGSGSDNTSIWYVTHGENHTALLVPENIPAGIQREDKGEQNVIDASGDTYFVKMELFRQHVGLHIRDWRKNSRIANIDVSDLNAGSVNLTALLRKGWHKAGMPTYTRDIKDGGLFATGRTVIYMNRTVFEALDAESTNATLHPALHLGRMEIQGEEVMTFRGLPIRVTDAITNTEAALA